MWQQVLVVWRLKNQKGLEVVVEGVVVDVFQRKQKKCKFQVYCDVICSTDFLFGRPDFPHAAFEFFPK